MNQIPCLVDLDWTINLVLTFKDVKLCPIIMCHAEVMLAFFVTGHFDWESRETAVMLQ